MLDVTNGPVEQAQTHKELHKADEIQQEIAHHIADHYSSDEHKNKCSDMGGIQASEVDQLLQNAA